MRQSTRTYIPVRTRVYVRTYIRWHVMYAHACWGGSRELRRSHIQARGWGGGITRCILYVCVGGGGGGGGGLYFPDKQAFS